MVGIYSGLNYSYVSPVQLVVITVESQSLMVLNNYPAKYDMVFKVLMIRKI